MISPLTIIRDIRDLKTFPTVSLIGPELNPEPFGAGGKGDGTLISLTCLVGGHGIGKSCNTRIYERKKNDRMCNYPTTKKAGCHCDPGMKCKEMTKSLGIIH